MNICCFRSSSYNAHSWCENRYYLEYVLGHRFPANAAAERGTIFHKTMEILAIIKKAKQDGKTEFVEDDILGKRQVPEEINVYSILDEVFHHYCKKLPHHNFGPSDLKDIKVWVDTIKTDQGGRYYPLNQDIFMPEQKFEFPIEKDWAKFSYKDKGNDISGYLGLTGTIDLMIEEDEETLHIIDYKGLPIDTPIPTIDGWKRMVDLEIGDIIFDENGKQTKITGKSQIKEKDCYQITFDDTTTVTSDDEHLWKLDNNTIVNTKNLQIGNKINIAKPLDINDIELPIDPYVLGIWLGDGRNRGAEISSADDFIFEEIVKRGYKIGNDISSRPDKICKQRTIYNLTKKLRELNLLHNKHIPGQYLRASYSQRLDLLRGLMDSDGSVNKIRKQAVFTNCKQELSTDVKELLLSLGQRPLQNYTFNNQFGRTINIYPISFRPININPFLLPVKANKIDKEWGYGYSNKRTIKKIDFVGKQKTQCIMVDSNTRTYLCTKNMIPTHNTGKTRVDWATGKEKGYDELMVDPQLRIYHYAASKLFPKYKYIMVTIYFLRAGGPFTLMFDESHIASTEDMLKRKFNTIKSSKIPKLTKTWKCTKLCPYSKNSFDDPLIEHRSAKFSKIGQPMSMCDQSDYLVKLKGIDFVTENYTAKGHSLGYYEAPGT